MLRFAVIFAGFAGAALAHSGATGIVKERMEGMKDMSHATKALGAVKAGAIPFSLATIHRAGGEIARAAEAARSQFPDGSIHGPSEALPLIFEQREKFDALLAELTVLGAKLAKSANEDEAYRLAEEIGANCKACHVDFRKK